MVRFIAEFESNLCLINTLINFYDKFINFSNTENFMRVKYGRDRNKNLEIFE